MGHRKRTEDIKTKIISIRMTGAEYEKLHHVVESFGYYSMARFIREEVIRTKTPAKSAVAFRQSTCSDIELIKQLQKLGTNLNQVNRVYHSIKKNGYITSNDLDAYIYKSTRLIELIANVLKQFE